MHLTDENIEYIATNLEFYGVKQPDLKEDLLDHICTYIENGDFSSFDEAYREAITKFGGQYAMSHIQQETFVMLTVQSTAKRKNMLYIFGSLAASLISFGGVFKILHWPTASILTLLGFIALNFFFLPLFFYNWYKNSKARQYSNH